MAVEPTEGKPNRSGRLSFSYGIVIGLVIALCVVALWAHLQAKRDNVRSSGPIVKSQRPGQSTGTSSPGSLKTVGGGNDLTLVPKDAPHVHALAPADWTLSTNPQASSVDLMSADKSLYAGWGVLAVNRAMQPYYGPLYGDSITSKAAILNLALKGGGQPADAAIGAAISKPGSFFTVREWTSSTRQGLIFYRDYPSGGGNYVESVYIASAKRDEWKSKGGIAVQVVSSIRAETQLLPPPPEPRASSGSGASSTDPDAAIDSSYNVQLGWQTVHSDSGTNYIVDPATDYNETGPDGPGYYVQSGNSYQKLSLGRSD